MSGRRVGDDRCLLWPASLAFPTCATKSLAVFGLTIFCRRDSHATHLPGAQTRRVRACRALSSVARPQYLHLRVSATTRRHLARTAFCLVHKGFSQRFRGFSLLIHGFTTTIPRVYNEYVSRFYNDCFGGFTVVSCRGPVERPTFEFLAYRLAELIKKYSTDDLQVGFSRT